MLALIICRNGEAACRRASVHSSYLVGIKGFRRGGGAEGTAKSEAREMGGRRRRRHQKKEKEEREGDAEAEGGC